MKFWLLTAAVVSTLSVASAGCVNNPCPATDYRSYSSCLSNQCPNTVVATGCPESKCTSVDCNTCSTSSACCHSCCRHKCECPSVSCNSCHSSNACCNICCPKQDCCTSKNREVCCTTHSDNSCCKDKTSPPTPVFPSITLPNITIVINQSAPIVYNTLNQSCGGVTTVRNSTHIVTTTGTCTNQTSPNNPCCIITHQPPCPYPIPPPICPPPVNNYACGPQCIIQPQVLIPPPPPQVIQPVIQPPAVIVPPQPVHGCYHYPINQCPQHCYGQCHWPRCVPVHHWPFIRCGGHGGHYYGGGIGGIGGYGGYIGHGGYVGQGGYAGQGGYGGHGAGGYPYIG